VSVALFGADAKITRGMEILVTVLTRPTAENIGEEKMKLNKCHWQTYCGNVNLLSYLCAVNSNWAKKEWCAEYRNFEKIV